MKLKYRLPLLLAGSAIMLSLLYLSLPNIVLYAISKTYGFGISYKSLRNDAFHGLYFTNLRIVETKRHIGLFSKDAYVKPAFRFLSVRSISFDLRDIYFIGGEEAHIKSFDNPMWYALMPFKREWTYRNITGEVSPIEGGIHLKDLTADSADIRLILGGDIRYKADIDLAFKVCFSKQLIDKWRMSNELSLYFMADEKDGGKSVSAVFKGAYGSPSVELSSPAFRLNIKPKE